MRSTNRQLNNALILAGALFLAACGVNEGPMVIKAGPEGTVMAVGTEASMELSEPGFKFRIQHSDTKGVSLGTAAGDSEAARNNEARLFVPASVTKVVTAALILKELGGDHRFQTEIVWDERESGVAADPIVFGDGDPQTSKSANDNGSLRPRLQELAVGIRNRGIRKIVGQLRLVSNDPRRDQANPPDGLDEEDHINCYGSRAQAFNFSRNCSSVVIRGLDNAAWAEASITTPLTLDLTAGAKQAISIIPQYDDVHSVVGYLLKGTFGSAAAPKYAALPVADAKSRYGVQLMKALKDAGIDVSETILVYPQEAEAQTLRLGRSNSTARFMVVSDAVSELIALMNKPSDNFMADALFRAFAVHGQAQDLRAAAIEIVERRVLEWMTRAGHPEYAAEIKLVDGAGLSRANRVSPRAFLTLLKEFSKEPTFPLLWESLAIAGVDGTLRGRMNGTAADNFARGKTGTLRGAYQLVGYLPAKGEYIPFVILSAATPANEGSVRAFQNRIVAKLAAQVKGQVQTEPTETAAVTPTKRSHRRTRKSRVASSKRTGKARRGSASSKR